MKHFLYINLYFEGKLTESDLYSMNRYPVTTKTWKTGTCMKSFACRSQEQADQIMLLLQRKAVEWMKEECKGIAVAEELMP